MNTETAATNQTASGSNTPTPSDTNVVPKKTLEERIQRLLIGHPKALFFGWALVILVFLAVPPTAYFAWYYLPSLLWAWSKVVWWHVPLALLATLFLLIVPIWVVMAAVWLGSFLADITLSIDETGIRRAQQTVRETELEAIERLENTDAAGLLPLLKYSRAQLEAYYAVGLSQARRSFFNSVLAMWLGFVVLLAGMALYIGPVERLGLKTPTEDFRNLIIGSGAIIEFISALFLWVYRSSITQLTNFYNRQMHSHTSILCFRMASTMDRAIGDETKRAIVEGMLRGASMTSTPPPTGARGMASLLGAGPEKTPA